MIQQSGFTHARIHANFTSHTTSSPLRSPPTHNSHSLCHLCIKGSHFTQYFPTFSSLLSLLLLKKVEGIISTVFLGPSESDTNSNCNQTHRSTRDCTCIFIVAISKPCAEAQGPQDQGHHNLNSLHPIGEMLISTVNANRSQQQC